MVVAETAVQALDAAEAVDVDYQVQPGVFHSEDAMQGGAPAVWDEVPDNILIDTMFGDRETTDRAFDRADRVATMTFHIDRVTGVPLEPRAALGHYDQNSGRYTLYAGSGGAVRQKRELASVLGIAAERLRVLSFDVGGNFGTRNRVFVEFGLVLWAARRLGRPVKFAATRSEAFLSDYQGRDLVTRLELAMRRDGRFLAMRATNLSNVGARCVSLSPLSKGAGLIPGSYDIPAATLRALAVYTNTMPTNAYRSSGRPEVTFAIERLIDIAAAEVGIDRVELRRRNLIEPDAMPYLNAVGMRYDSGRYRENMHRAMEIADWDGFGRRRRDAAARGRLLGRGLANYVESSIGAPNEQARIAVRPEGRVDVVIGTQPSGQGHETSFAQVIADLLCVPIESVRIILGDTDVVRVGGGSHSGRSMRHAATVFSKAAPELIARGKRMASILLATSPDRIEFADGRFGARDTNVTYDFLELAREAAKHDDLPAELADGISVVTDNEMHDPVFPNGCAVCEVEVDPETGETSITRYASVDDVGRCINPLIVHGQTHGAIAQGIGQAMWERCQVEDDTGQPLVGSLMDYGLPRADALPRFRTEIAEVLSPTNPLGIKAGGEGGTTAAPAAVISAIVDALRDYGIRDIKMPATPFAIWSAIEKANEKSRSNEVGGRLDIVRRMAG
jgi:carbon-monoxide dehydrogenase large subunit